MNTRIRIMLITLVPITLIYLAVLLFSMTYLRSGARAKLERTILVATARMADRFDGHLQRVDAIATTTATFVETYPDISEAQLYAQLRANVLQDELVYGAAAGFVDQGFDDRERFCPYVHRVTPEAEEVAALDIAQSYDYLADGAWEWWYRAADAGRGVWTEPYFDEGAGNVLMSTYSVPFYRDGALRGVTTVDIPLEPLNAMIRGDWRSEGVDFFVVSSGGHFVSDPNPERIATKTLDDVVDELGGKKFAGVAKAMLAGEHGVAEVPHFASGETMLVVYAPIESAEWSLAVQMPLSVVYDEIRPQLVGFAGVLLLSLVLISGSTWLASGKIAEAQQHAIEQEERVRLLLESTGEGIFGADPDGRVMFVNRAAAELLGFTRDELLGKPIHDLIHHTRPDGSPYPIEDCPMYQACALGRTSFVDSEVLWRKDRSSFDVEYSCVPLRADDAVVGTVVVFRDITERKRSEEEIRHARDAALQANRAKSAFLANMSHELRTPMNAIIGYSEMLIEEAEDLDPDEFVPDLEKIRGAGKHLLALINDILDLSKIEAGKMDLYAEDFDLSAMVADIASTVDTLIRKKSNKLVIEEGENLGAMHSDLTKVRQALFNLISNAAKFTEQGTITLAVARSHEPDGDWVTLSVTDTGIGIAADKISSLFEEFTQADASTTRQFGGTGLGLAITKRFCSMMGGQISVDSELGAGSTFTLHLPAEIEVRDGKRVEPSTQAAPQQTYPAVRRAAEPSPGERACVLVIDDDDNAADLLKRTLEGDGFDVVVARSGKEGLQRAYELQPLAITLDVMMPGEDGWSILRELKGDPELHDIPVLMVSMVRDKNLGYALGASDYLTKPIDRERLVRVVRRFRAEREDAPVLVIEDDAATRQMLRRMLERDGWAVVEATNGEEGLACVPEAKPSLILLDLMMPVMDGFAFMEHLRQVEQWREIPVVVVTAKDLDDADRRRLQGNVERILQKGAYTRDELVEQVRRLVHACSGKGGSSRGETA